MNPSAIWKSHRVRDVLSPWRRPIFSDDKLERILIRCARAALGSQLARGSIFLPQLITPGPARCCKISSALAALACDHPRELREVRKSRAPAITIPLATRASPAGVNDNLDT